MHIFAFYIDEDFISAINQIVSELTDVEVMRISDTYSLSEAAEVLGFENFRNVNELIRKGFLKSYKTKFSRNKRVLRKEVEALTEVEEI